MHTTLNPVSQTITSILSQADWSPTYTLTEDFALGMELKKRNWSCRYVCDYLAIGEAPTRSATASSSAPAGPRCVSGLTLLKLLRGTATTLLGAYGKCLGVCSGQDQACLGHCCTAAQTQGGFDETAGIFMILLKSRGY